MENKSNNSGNNFFSGFLLGAIIGAAIVFLLGTKKGKKILKAISEEGEGKISNILDKIENSIDLPDEEVLENETIKKTVSENRQPVRNNSRSVSGESVTGGKVRRFFRGIPRHLN